METIKTRIEEAVKINDIDTVKTLLSQTDDTGEALVYAVKNNNIRMVKLLVGKSKTTSRALDAAASNNYIEILAFLLKRGTEISPYCVHWTSFAGKEEALKLLLENGAVIDKAFTDRFVYNKRICQILGVNYWTQNFFPMTILV